MSGPSFTVTFTLVSVGLQFLSPEYIISRLYSPLTKFGIVIVALPSLTCEEYVLPFIVVFTFPVASFGNSTLIVTFQPCLASGTVTLTSVSALTMFNDVEAFDGLMFLLPE